MRRFVLVLLVLGLVPAVALAARTAAGPPGTAAPKSLVGVWRTTLDQKDLERLKAPGENHRTWELVILNGKYLAYPRALGLRPVGVKGDTVPFAVSGNRLLVSCLNDLGIATKGYGVYRFAVTGKTLQLTLVKEPCSDTILRDRIVILTSHPWRRTGSM
jgi:hypothetical protein